MDKNTELAINVLGAAVSALAAAVLELGKSNGFATRYVEACSQDLLRLNTLMKKVRVDTRVTQERSDV